MDLPFIAGRISTVIFATSMLPMLIKARRTRDLTSYSLGNIVLSNLGNLVHSTLSRVSWNLRWRSPT
jgi:hypothetical protein